MAVGTPFGPVRLGVEVLDSAAGLGRFSAAQWLHTHRKDACTTRAMDYAAGRGHLSMVK